MTQAAQTPVPIPQPRPWPVLGNLLDADPHAPVQRLMEQARTFGPIFRFDLPGRRMLVLSSQKLVDEVSDESRFDKLVWGPLRAVRAFLGDGLFTARTSEPNWQKAHRILLPTFSAKAMQAYMPQMIDIAEQLVMKWERLNPEDVIDVGDDMTRLTLDTIGLCGFDYRFNSFYRQEPHPFVLTMVRALSEALAQLHRLPIQNSLMFGTRRRFERDIAYMNGVVDRLIKERRADPAAASQKHDLLNYMLSGADKTTGERLDDVNIRYQIITFLIAGHETTSGLLSFTLHYLLRHPDVLAKAYEEVDRVLGGDPCETPTFAQIHRLVYAQQILKESLRLWPTAPAFALAAFDDTTIGEGYPVRREDEVVVLIPMLHRDRSVWGEDAEEFNPDRFAPDRERRIPSNAYKPFGNGQRACIGRQFALQEATMVLAMILRRFELVDHSNYQLRIKETLTLKPDGFTIKVRPRPRRTSSTPASAPAPASALVASEEVPAVAAAAGMPLLVLYGSNLGTAEGVAQRIAEDGEIRGFSSTVAPLDDYIQRLPTTGALVVVSSSYNGSPPDNAARFCDWLQKDDPAPDVLSGVRYAVFGCGDHNWAATYQAIPKKIDERLAALGATRIYPRGEADAADDFDGQFRAWYGPFWNRIGSELGLKLAPSETSSTRSPYRVEVVAARPGRLAAASQEAKPMRVVANRELQTAEGSQPCERSTRHIELALPAGTTYHAGDHLGVLPRNRVAMVRRVLDRFRLDGEALVVIRREAPGKSHLPLDEPLPLYDLLTSYVELQDTATRSQLEVLAAETKTPYEKSHLSALLDGGEDADLRYRDEVFAKHLTVLDILEQFPTCSLSFDDFLGMLPPLRPRYYSISSSPLACSDVASITVAVVRGPARSGRGVYEGVTSAYLAEVPPGATILGFVRSPGTAFCPPSDPRTPMIMVGAGTGLAPFRGFLQERAAIRERGQEVGPALLFFGCRHPRRDFLYESELRDFDARGIARLIPGFSRCDDRPRCYVQNSIVENAGVVWDLVRQEANIYVCGDASRMAPDVRAAFRSVYQTKNGADAAAADAWLNDLVLDQRYVEDVWASG